MASKSIAVIIFAVLASLTGYIFLKSLQSEVSVIDSGVVTFSWIINMRNKFIIASVVVIIITIVGYVYWRHIESEAIAVDKGVVAHKKGNYNEAVTILEPYAEKGNQAAELTMGMAYAFGQGVKKYREKAKKYLLSSVDDRAPEFYFWVAESFENGEGVERNTDEALAWYKYASEAGHPTAKAQVDRPSKLE